MSNQTNTIIWSTTIWINFLRAAFAGIVWTIVFSMAGEENAATLLAFPISYFLFILPISWVLKQFKFWLFALFSLALSFSVIVGDPFVYLIKQINPKWIPVEKFNLVNFTPIVTVHE